MHGVARIFGIIIWLSFIPLIEIYFSMGCSEINGLIGYQSNWVTLAVFVVAVASTILSRILHLAEEVMALGITGLVVFVIFLAWAIASAPEGPNTVPSTGSPFNIIAILVTSF